MQKTATLDGKQLTFTDATVFAVQIGKDNGAYKTRFSSIGNIAQAVMMYKGYNIGNGYKKRLLMGKQVLARQVSH